MCIAKAAKHIAQKRKAEAEGIAVDGRAAESVRRTFAGVAAAAQAAKSAGSFAALKDAKTGGTK